MIKVITKWFILLICCFVISTFLHEMGHGISSYAAGIPVSTGFNKVGMPYEKPSDIDFRKGFENDNTPWDMGPNVTLLLAIGFTILLIKMKNKNQLITMTIGAFALCNSVIRLIPMIHSYFGLLTQGSLNMEDEIGNGLAWFKIYNLGIIKYLPSLISIVVSLFCLYFVIKTLKIKLPSILSSRLYFTITLVLAYIVSFVIENGLDNVIRINWV